MASVRNPQLQFFKGFPSVPFLSKFPVSPLFSICLFFSIETEKDFSF